MMNTSFFSVQIFNMGFIYNTDRKLFLNTVAGFNKDRKD